MGKHGNIDHLKNWNSITGREDTNTSFRKILSDYSLNTDAITRANLAFIDDHNQNTMEEVYVSGGKKLKEGIKALLKYRKEELNQEVVRDDDGNIPRIKIPRQMERRQNQSEFDEYHKVLSDNIEKERELNERQKGSANGESRASIIELCAIEVKSRKPTNTYFLADMLLQRKPKVIDMTKDKLKVAILNVIDRFSDTKESLSLQNLLNEGAKEMALMEGGPIDGTFLNKVESVVINKWQNQLDKMSSEGKPLRGIRIPAALVAIAKLTNTEDTYCMGNSVIARNVMAMLAKQKRLKDQLLLNTSSSSDDSHTMTPTSIVNLHRRNTARLSPSDKKVKLMKSAKEMRL